MRIDDLPKAVMMVPRSVFGIIAMAADEGTKYADSGVLLDQLPNGDCLAAVTDGRMLAVAEWSDCSGRYNWANFHGERGELSACCSPFRQVVPRSLWVRVASLLNWRRIAPGVPNNCQVVGVSDWVAFSAEEPHRVSAIVAHEGGDMRVCGDASGMQFPDWRQVVPEYHRQPTDSEIDCITDRACAAFILSPKLMGRGLKFLSEIGESCVIETPLESRTSKNPIIMRCVPGADSNISSAMVVLMGRNS